MPLGWLQAGLLWVCSTAVLCVADQQRSQPTLILLFQRWQMKSDESTILNERLVIGFWVSFKLALWSRLFNVDCNKMAISKRRLYSSEKSRKNKKKNNYCVWRPLGVASRDGQTEDSTETHPSHSVLLPRDVSRLSRPTDRSTNERAAAFHSKTVHVLAR